ncbi:DUF2207 domain-containing protein [Candidatus Woesebacteria bacterium]|nr:DUF2207 domain-containing protein [Candidatus Woesebacteria bacterium]
MRIFLLTLITSLSMLLNPGLTFAQPSADSFSERITHMRVDMEIRKDGKVEVTEEILYDFGAASRHGIYRSIPTDKPNNDGNLYRMKMENIEVTDENGAAYNFSTTRIGDTLELKIGDADTTITGLHTYVIHYILSGAMTYFQDVDELYWNAVGTAWNVPIDQVIVDVKIPSEVDQEKMQYTCFYGEKGQSDKICSINRTSDHVTYTAQNILPQEGLTIALRFPQGVIGMLEPELVVNFFDTLLGQLTLAGIMLALFMWYIAYPLWIPIQWWLAGRDPEHRGVGVTTAWFEGPKLTNGREMTPAETGAIIDEKIQMREFAALIIHLAQKGFFTIVEKKKNDFELHKVENPSPTYKLLDFEQVFITDVFKHKSNVRIKDERETFSNLVPKIEQMTYEQLLADGLFPKNPKSIRTYYAVITGIATFTFNILLVISAGIFGRIMPRKTLDGVHMANVAKSLKNFLVSQERQLEFLAKSNLPAGRQVMFEKLLPYAIAFGVEKIWADRFKDLELKQPDWYQSSSTQMFTAQALSSSLHGSFANSLRSAATTTTSTSGYSSGFSGGSVGGGGGGGGGGSW